LHPIFLFTYFLLFLLVSPSRSIHYARKLICYFFPFHGGYAVGISSLCCCIGVFTSIPKLYMEGVGLESSSIMYSNLMVTNWSSKHLDNYGWYLNCPKKHSMKWTRASWTNWTKFLSTCGVGGRTWKKTKKTTLEQELEFG